MAWGTRSGTGQRDQQLPQKGKHGLLFHGCGGVVPAPRCGIEPVEPVAALVLVLGKNSTMAGCRPGGHRQNGGGLPAPTGAAMAQVSTSRAPGLPWAHHHFLLVDAAHLHVVNCAAAFRRESCRPAHPERRQPTGAGRIRASPEGRQQNDEVQAVPEESHQSIPLHLLLAEHGGHGRAGGQDGQQPQQIPAVEDEEHQNGQRQTPGQARFGALQ